MLIKNNILKFDSSDFASIIRCPIIPDVNDTENHFNGIAMLANELKNVIIIEIDSCNGLGQEKSEKIEKNFIQILAVFHSMKK